MLVLNPTATLYPPQKAEEIASDLSASDPDWRYSAVHDPKGTGLSFIEVHDEDGHFIGKL